MWPLPWWPSAVAGFDVSEFSLSLTRILCASTLLIWCVSTELTLWHVSPFSVVLVVSSRLTFLVYIKKYYIQMNNITNGILFVEEHLSFHCFLLLLKQVVHGLKSASYCSLVGLLLSLQILLYEDIIKSIIFPITSYDGITITSINPK